MTIENPLSALVKAIDGLRIAGEAADADGAIARPDVNREERTGVPEVIFATGKRPEQVLSIARSFLDQRGRVIISRVEPSLGDLLAKQFASEQVEHDRLAEMVVIRQSGQLRLVGGGKVGIITAGTSDLPWARQAKIVAEEMGCTVSLIADVGVAGLHRLIEPLQALLREQVDVIIVAAGMDGALPSVVSGLVDRPVIGLPTSTGYGYGGQGVAALMSMLQTCAPGLTVVNIDNGIGAGASAALIANRVARARVG